MNLFQKMSKLSNITPNEQILIDYIKTYPVDFISLRPREISARTYVSVPTIYRLINKLGLNGINDLKLELSSSLKQKEENQVDNIDYPILPTDTHYEVMLRLKEVYLKTIDDTLDLADPETLVTVSELMIQAKVIDVYTSSANIFFAENFQFQMQEINVPVSVPQADYMQKLTAANSDSTHLAMVISFGGRGSGIETICKILKSNHVTILLITSTFYNPLASYAGYCIYLSSYENHYNKISSFSTRMTLLYILDTLYSICFKQNYDKNASKKIESYEKMRAGSIPSTPPGL